MESEGGEAMESEGGEAMESETYQNKLVYDIM